MKPDLLYSKACIDWAVSQFPAFQQRIDNWLDLNVDMILREVEANPTHDMLMLIEKEPFPLALSVEAGAYINAIRSSLDILATTLAYRHGIPRPDKHSFPIAASAAVFDSRKGFKGDEFIKAIPDSECRIIESLKPYKGGDDRLWALHEMNNLSKHRRLLAVDNTPARIRLTGFCNFVPVSGPGWVKANGETVLGFLSKNTSNVQIQFSAHVTVEESGILERKPILATLNDFASLATSIINLFA